MDLRLALTHLMLYYVAQLRRDSGLPGMRAWLEYDCEQDYPDIAALREKDGQALVRYASGVGVDATAPNAADALLESGHALKVWDLIRSSIIDPAIPASREWRLRFPREVATFEMLRCCPGAREIHVQGDEVFYKGGQDNASAVLSRGITLTGDPSHG